MTAGAQKGAFQEVKAEIADLLRSSLRHYVIFLLHSVGEDKSRSQLRIQRERKEWSLNGKCDDKFTSIFTSPHETPPMDSWKYLRSTLYEVNQCLTLERGSRTQWKWNMSVTANPSVPRKDWGNSNDNKAISIASITCPVPIAHISVSISSTILSVQNFESTLYVFPFWLCSYLWSLLPPLSCDILKEYINSNLPDHVEKLPWVSNVFCLLL